jgi:hypothetical protein
VGSQVPVELGRNNSKGMWQTTPEVLILILTVMKYQHMLSTVVDHGVTRVATWEKSIFLGYNQPRDL